MTLLIFALTYFGVAVGHIASLKLNRTGIALVGGILMVATGNLSPDAALDSVNFATLILLYGLMIVSGQLWISGFYTWTAQKIAELLDRPKHFLLLLMILSGTLSAFLINDVVCLAFAPVVTLSVVAKRLNPLPFLIALAVSANIGAAATPIGNAQNILIATEAHLHYAQYLLWCFVPVALSLAAAFFIVWAIGKRQLELKASYPAMHIDFPPINRFETYKGLVALAIVVVLFFTHLPKALVMISAAGVLLVSRRVHSAQLFAKVDWSVLTLFGSLFIVVGAFKATGLAGVILAWLSAHGWNLQNPYLLALTTGVMSNLMSNAATIMLLARTLPLDHPVIAYTLALSNSFAGNFLLIGSIANLIVAEQAAQYGVSVSFKEFARYGVPVTIASFGILLLWIWVML